MAMKCAKCGISVMKRPLTRINEKGIAGIWWCWPCLKTHEPELYKNLKEEVSEVEKICIDECYNGKEKI